MVNEAGKQVRERTGDDVDVVGRHEGFVEAIVTFSQ